VPAQGFGSCDLGIYSGDIELEGGIAGEAVDEAWVGNLGIGEREKKGRKDKEKIKRRER
jgi:hypothetical protein